MPIRTDDACGGRVMELVLTGGQVKWVCFCGNSYPGSPEDTLLAQGDLRPSAQSYTTATYARAAATDRVAARVKRDCDRCGLDTMVAIRGNRMELIYLCPFCDAPNAPPSAKKEKAPPAAKTEKAPALKKEKAPAAKTEKAPPAEKKEKAPPVAKKASAAKKAPPVAKKAPAAKKVPPAAKKAPAAKK